MIEVKGLSKVFKDIKAVDNLNFIVNEKEVYGLLGENGAGKTTTLRMLATMLKPTSGNAIMNGIDLIKQPELIRKEIGILFGGESGLYDRLTARENITYFAELYDMSRNDIKIRIDYLVSKFGMEEFIDRPAGKLSKGMKQKVAIARSIVHDPKIMLFDEPTSGLDVTSSREVHDFINLCRDEGKSIIFSSHSMPEVEKLCDMIGIIHKGKLVAEGTIDELKNKYNNDNLEEIFMELVGEKSEV
ncbi:ATP-binding cassette domain-containing protein [Thermoanaerobacterium sp. RBIITD]|uniref:ABC transporter ATP-binding protein n=1 Tax=Thermoanaerobacterium sp. RBIITD TaxID=1550240 RepID=UPI000BB8877A|nr:ATP-binding cassette domain-containing protein [Thermoanaerobacterium sp. RBIITD]SNX53988.1 sodium transport system ATP-binding protein [Thermoanaerobacterium sp. RBIITD]